MLTFSEQGEGQAFPSVGAVGFSWPLFFLRAYFSKNVKFSQRNILAKQRTLLALFYLVLVKNQLKKQKIETCANEKYWHFSKFYYVKLKFSTEDISRKVCNFLSSNITHFEILVSGVHRHVGFRLGNLQHQLCTIDEGVARKFSLDIWLDSFHSCNPSSR